MTQLASLKDIAERIDYGLTTSATVDGIGPKFLRITDIDKSYIDWNSVPTCAASAEEIEKYSLQSGDIVVARTGASTGRSQWVEIGDPTVFASYLVRFRISEDYDSRFVGYVLNSRPWHDYVDSVAHGKSAQPNMSAAAMAEFDFSCPPLHQQEAIAEVLGALDDKIAANTKLASTADELAFLKYSAAVASATFVPMSQKLHPILGGTPSRSQEDYWGGDQRWISAKDVTGAFGQLILDTEEKITTLASENTKAKPLPKGSVIMTARGTVGAVARLGEPSSFNQSCYGFIPGEVSASILYFAVRSAADHAKSMAHGSVFDTITKKTFDHLLMPELTSDDANNLDAVLSPLLSVVESSARENLKLAEIRDALLPQLMSGKLRVKDAEKVIEEAV